MLLVGETMGGCHPRALETALRQALARRAAGEPVGVLGPTFSGSIHELGASLRKILKDQVWTGQDRIGS